MVTLVANKNESYSSALPATTFFPEIKVSEFQSLFHFLGDGKEAGILHAAKVERIAIHKELKEIEGKYENLTELSQDLFGDDESAEVLYKQAVFCKTAYALINNRISTDATKEAADRQEALMKQADEQLASYRSAMVHLQPDVSGYTFELV